MKVVSITWVEPPTDVEPVRIVDASIASDIFPLIRRFLSTAKKGEVMILRIDEMTRKAFKGLRED